MKDRYRRFAGTWESIGLSKKVKWRGYRIHEDVRASVISRMIDAFGSKAVELLEDTYYQAGIADGKKMASAIGTAKKDALAALLLIETVCLMSGVEAEYIEKKPEHAVLSIGGCPFREFFEGLEHPTNVAACLRYIEGMVRSVNREAKVEIGKRYCEGSDKCNFTISVGRQK
jgi:hypothetical protein